MEFKEFRPSRKISGPRWVEFSLQSLFFICVLVFLSYLGIDLLIGKQSYFFESEGFNWGMVLYAWFLFFSYKVATTHTIIDNISINHDISLITFNYWLFYLIKKECKIKFTELSLNTRDDLLFFGASKSIRVFQNNKYKIKINPRNGWNKLQIDEILKELLIISNGKMRRKKWQFS